MGRELSTYPSADHIARAIVTACRLANENPIAVVGERVQQSRARQYAFQALQEVFPDANPETLAYQCGCSGKPHWFWKNSNNNMLRYVGGPHAGKRKHRFWNEDVFAEVIGAVRSVGPGIVDADETAVVTPPPPAPPLTIPMSRPFISERQAKAYRLLSEAVANTAKLPTKG